MQFILQKVHIAVYRSTAVLFVHIFIFQIADNVRIAVSPRTDLQLDVNGPSLQASDDSDNVETFR